MLRQCFMNTLFDFRETSNLFPSSSFMHVDITDNGARVARQHCYKKRQLQLGRMADFLLAVTFSVLDL